MRSPFLVPLGSVPLFQPVRSLSVPFFPHFQSSLPLLYLTASPWQSVADTTPTQQPHALTDTHVHTRVRSMHVQYVRGEATTRTKTWVELRVSSKRSGQIGPSQFDLADLAVQVRVMSSEAKPLSAVQYIVQPGVWLQRCQAQRM